jgi:hypothetical protein
MAAAPAALTALEVDEHDAVLDRERVGLDPRVLVLRRSDRHLIAANAGAVGVEDAAATFSSNSQPCQGQRRIVPSRCQSNSPGLSQPWCRSPIPAERGTLVGADVA